MRKIDNTVDWAKLEEIEAEHHYLKWFWKNVRHAFGPAHADIYAMMEEDYERKTKKKSMVMYPE